MTNPQSEVDQSIDTKVDTPTVDIVHNGDKHTESDLTPIKSSNDLCNNENETTEQIDVSKEDKTEESSFKVDPPISNVDNGSRIIRQVEYYFSDANLLRDKFMKAELEKNDGWMGVDILLSFNRLKLLTTDAAFLLKSLSNSTSKLLEIDIAEQRIRRDPLGPAPPATKAELDKRTFERTVFVDGFPITATPNELIDFFVDQWYTDDVKLRKKLMTKEFLGSVFVVFSTKEAAAHFVLLDQIKYKDHKLDKQLLEDFQKSRANKLTNECKQDKEMNKLNAVNESTVCSEESIDQRMIPGSVLYIDGLTDECSRELLKEQFSDHVRVYADYNRGDKEGWLRFAEPNSAQAALDAILKANDNTLKFGELIPSSYKVLEGECERDYWRSVVQKIEEFKNKRKGSRRYGRNRNNNKRQKLAD